MSANNIPTIKHFWYGTKLSQVVVLFNRPWPCSTYCSCNFGCWDLVLVLVLVICRLSFSLCFHHVLVLCASSSGAGTFAGAVGENQRAVPVGARGTSTAAAAAAADGSHAADARAFCCPDARGIAASAAGVAVAGVAVAGVADGADGTGECIRALAGARGTCRGTANAAATSCARTRTCATAAAPDTIDGPVNGGPVVSGAVEFFYQCIAAMTNARDNAAAAAAAVATAAAAAVAAAGGVAVD